MNSTIPLSGTLLKTYDTIFQHPEPHNLEWSEVHALFRHLGQVEQEPNGSLRVTRNGQMIMLRLPLTEDVAETGDLIALRHFLERSETALKVPDSPDAHWLLVIDHQEARLFRSDVEGALPQKLLPQQLDLDFRRTQNPNNLSRGGDETDPTRYFEPIAQALQGVGQLLIFGTGTGNSSEMDQFVAWLSAHHPEIARRVIGSLVVDQSHLTDAQLLEQARAFRAHRALGGA